MSVENSPEFQKALKEACDVQWRDWLYGGDAKKSKRGDVEKDLNKIQQMKEKAEERVKKIKREFRRMHNPMARRIMENLKTKYGVQGGFICPKCGEGDKNNTMNGKPWCFKCNVELVPADKVGKWVDIKKGDWKDSIYREMRGLS